MHHYLTTAFNMWSGFLFVCLLSITLHLSCDCVQCAIWLSSTFWKSGPVLWFMAGLILHGLLFLDHGSRFLTSTSDCSLLIFCWNWDFGSQFERSFQKGPYCLFEGLTDGPVECQRESAVPLSGGQWVPEKVCSPWAGTGKLQSRLYPNSQGLHIFWRRRCCSHLAGCVPKKSSPP